jgi:maltose O-acetyltransferase
VGKNGKKGIMFLRKVKRGFFWLMYYWFARHLPRSHVRYAFGSRSIRAFLLKRLFKSFGRKVDIGPKVFFFNMSESEIGDYSGIGIYSYVSTVKIGRDVMIGDELLALSQDHEFANTEIPMRMQGFREDQPIVIEDDVWIGSRVIILPGIKICRGSIVGAGSVVTEDVPAYTIVAGNPARQIGRRR